MKTPCRLATVTAIAAISAGATAASQAQEGPTSSISGRVSYRGAVPAPKRIDVSSDPKCLAMHPEGLETKVIDVSGGGLAHAFVWLRSGVSGSYPLPAAPVVLSHQGCELHPHILAVRAGQAITIRNDDDALHNTHPRPAINQEFNIGQPRKGLETSRTFDKQEVMIPVSCEVHPWTRAYISVVGHPFFAVTREDGTYEIKNVPPGEYEVEVLHEKLKSQTKAVTVRASAGAKVDFVYGP